MKTAKASKFNKTTADRRWAIRLLDSEIMRIVTYAESAVKQEDINQAVRWMGHWPKRPDLRRALERLVDAGALEREMHYHGYIRSWLYLPAWRGKRQAER